MSFFERIKNAVFGKAEAAPQPPTLTTGSNPAPREASEPATPALETAAGKVDVGAILDAAVKRSGQVLDWKRSIVDLLKALGFDSSLSARKELAAELGYTGNTSDSAAMNMWLHKAVIKKLSDNGGKVPRELLD